MSFLCSIRTRQTQAEISTYYITIITLSIVRTMSLLRDETNKRRSSMYSKGSMMIMMMTQKVEISSHVCGKCARSRSTPKTQPNGSPALIWLSFWSSNRFTRKKCLSQRGKTYTLHSYIFYYVVFEQPFTIRLRNPEARNPKPHYARQFFDFCVWNSRL